MSDQEKSTTTQPATGWPGGWYVYENGRVEGPYSAEDTFKLSSDAVDGKPRLVSRKGFSQWYALKDLSELFRVTDQFGRKVQAQTEITEAQLIAAQAMTHIPAPPAQVAAPHTPVPSRTTVSKKHIKVEGRNDRTKPVIGGAALEALAKDASKVKSMPAAEEPTKATAPHLDSPKAAKTVKAKQTAPSAQTQALVLQEYFLARGRLRLGKLRNPWISAFVGLPLTAGVFWALWMRDLGREAVFHARNHDKTPMPPTFLALVPVVHIYMTFRLAKLMVEMEAQNRYRSITPWVAALFSIFPPFAMAYLQDAANRHWLLHVKHAMVKKKSPGE